METVGSAFDLRWLPLGLGLMTISACLGPGVFACEQDTQCGAGGRCADPGYCAFPEGTCDSGYKFGKYAGQGLADECVDPNSTGTGESDGTGTETTGTTDDGTATDSEDETTEPAVCGNGEVETGEYCDGPVDHGLCRATCDLIDCDADWDDCNGMGGDGCEAPLGAWSSCGSCDNVCDAKVCDAGQCGMLVFVTSDVWAAADVGGIVGADAKCQAEADGAGLTGTYKAWISLGGVMPAFNFTKSDQPYARPDGEIIAPNFDGMLDSALDKPILMTLDLGEPPVANTCPRSAWTNTKADGTVIATQACGNFAGGAANEYARTGHYESVNAAWTDGCAELCVNIHPLYCVQQPGG